MSDGMLTEEETKKLLDKMRNRMMKKLVGFEKGDPYKLDNEKTRTVSPPSDHFPIPELLLFTLSCLLGYPFVRNRDEKIRWTVYGSLKGQHFCLELRKMGFYFLFDPAIEEANQKRIFGQLHCMLAAVNDDLKIVAKDLIKSNEVLVVNRFVEFDDRYQFFRTKAHDAFAENGFQADPNDNDMTIDFKKVMHDSGVSRAGFYYAVAMVDVFFSRMEHMLLLHFAFQSRCGNVGDLHRFMNLSWKERFQQMVNIDRDETRRQNWAKLIKIKDSIRNAFAHGGSENDGSSLIVQLPVAGPVPASLRGFKESPRASGMNPIERDDYESICLLFDQIDEMMKCEDLSLSFQMIEGGLDAAFDAESQASYQDAIAKPDELANYIDAWNQRWMDYANCD